MPFIFIVHQPPIVSQPVNDRGAIAICMLIVSLAISWADTRVVMLRQTETDGLLNDSTMVPPQAEEPRSLLKIPLAVASFWKSGTCNFWSQIS